MSFEKYEWQKGETITAEKLNRIEDGIEEAMQGSGGNAGLLIVHSERYPCPNDSSMSYAVLDTTWQTIKDAYDADCIVLWKEEFESEFGWGKYSSLLIAVRVEEGLYSLTFLDENANSIIFDTDSENGYPTNSAGCQGAD